MNLLVVEEIRDRKSFSGLKGLWNSFLETNGLLTPFTQFEWFASCIDCYGKGKELRVLLVRDQEDGMLHGIAPFWIGRDVYRGLRVRELSFIECLDTPCSSIFSKAGHEERAIDAIFGHLCQGGSKGWDLAVFRKLPEGYGGLKEIFGSGNGRRILWFEEYPTRNLYVDIEGDWEKFLKGRSERFRKTRRNIMNRISKIPGVAIELFTADPDGRLMDLVLDVTRKGWKAEEGLALSSRPETVEFFRQMTKWALEKQMLLIWVLTIDGAPVAVEYDLRHKGKVYALRSDFDGGQKSISPGAYLEYKTVEHLFTEGYREYDMGPGFNEYKTHWTEKYRELQNLAVCNRSFKGMAIWSIENWAIPVLRKAKHLFSR